MKAADWIDRVKKVKGWESDYRVAKERGFKANTISTYRKTGGPMDENIALKVAEALGVNPAGVMVDQLAERSKSESVRATLAREVERLCILCKVKSAIKRIAAPTHSARALA